VIIHFICRGNAFRSIIAEAYLNSLHRDGVTVRSSGTVADSHKAANLPHYESTLELLGSHGIREFAKPGYGDQLSPQRLAGTDIAVCMNRRVYDDAVALVTFPAGLQIWSVADVGEPGRISAVSSERDRFREEAFTEITRNVDVLLSGWPA
jgi:protein-tyrosine-phosphatase